MWVRSIDVLRGQTGAFVQTSALLSSVGFLFLASQLATVGVAFYAYSLSTRRVSEGAEQVKRTLDRIERLLKEEKFKGPRPSVTLDIESLREQSLRKLSGIHFLAIVEGLGLLLLYGWLVEEFQSNIYTQDWARANTPWAFYFLNEYVLLLLVGLLAGFLGSRLRTFRRRHPAVLHS